MKALTLKFNSNRAIFISMATTYFLGVFNDNFFKQAALLMAVTAGLSQLQGTATVLFSLPFILFSAYGGWLADRYSKRNVIIGTKSLELVAMIIGAVGLVYTNWLCILSMVFLMGLQSTLFSPALNGSIPELYPQEKIVKVNSRLKAATTTAILLGIASAGIVLDQNWLIMPGISSGQTLIAASVVMVSLTGLLASFKIPGINIERNKTSFPWTGPVQSLKNFFEIQRDPKLFLAISGDAFFYSIASITILVINSFCLNQLGFTKTITSFQSVSMMIGVCIGAFFAARKITPAKWTKVLAPGTFGMGSCLLFASLTPFVPTPLQPVFLCVALTATGFYGGYFLIPVASFIQVRPSATDKGKVISTANFCGFTGILVSGQLFTFLITAMSPAKLMGFLGATTIVASFMFLVYLRWIEGKTLNSLVLIIKQLLKLRYRIEVKGLENIEKKEGEGILFLPNHPALIDPIILTTILFNDFNPRPLSDKDQTDIPIVRAILRKLNFISIPNLMKNGRSSKKEVIIGMNSVVKGLEEGDNIIMYPAGRIYRSNLENISGKSGVEYILRKRPLQRIVLVRTHGLWGSSFSRASGNVPSLFGNFGKYVLAIFANGIFFVPKRKVIVEFHEPQIFPRHDDKIIINSFLVDFYNENAPAKTHFPLYRWQGSTALELPEIQRDEVKISTKDIPYRVIKKISKKIEELSGTASIEAHHNLMQDIGLDSLNIVELATWIEERFSVSQVEPESLQTVGDCCRIAVGNQKSNSTVTDKSVVKGWFLQGNPAPLKLAAGSTIAEKILGQARKNPGDIVMADRLSGAMTFRNLIASIYALKPEIEKITSENVGIMLPASVSANILYLSAMFAGKTPVMLNWTTGDKNLRHCLEVAGVNHVFTAKAFADKLKKQGRDLSDIEVSWQYLEDIRNNMTRATKIKSFIKSYLPWNPLLNVHIGETAAILFTSGSETLPKAVPLTHKNILANVKDFASVISFKNTDRLVGILPPFHSLGLTGTMILPLCLGLKTVYYPDPTQSLALAKLIQTYRSTILITTPTFMANILRASSESQMSSLRLIFAGAEKCPGSLHESLSKLCPDAVLCEGYGATECAPLVSVNTENNSKQGSIGQVLPGIDHLLVYSETGIPVVEPGEQGVLLVRGDNVFNGYLNNSGKSPFIKHGGKHWYNTGDLVSEDENGFLTFCGRQKRFIKIGGEMISLPAIESALQQHVRNDGTTGPAVAVEAASSDERPQVVLFTTSDIKRDEANSLIRKEGLSSLHNIHRLIHVDSIPILGTGKTDYQQLKNCLANS